jgi:hypothetical protein
MKPYRRVSEQEKQALIAAFELKQSLTDKALGKKYGRSYRSIACLRWKWRADGKL